MERLSASQIKKRRFAELVAVHTDQQEAAAQAGYKRGPGLPVTASRLMDDPEVMAHLAKLRAASESNAVAKKEELERILTEDVRADFGDFLSSDGTLDLTKLKKCGRRIKSVTFSEKGTRIEMQDRHGAIGLLGKMRGYFAAEKVETKVSVDESKFPPGFLNWAAGKVAGEPKAEGGVA